MAWYSAPASNALQWGANVNQALGGDSSKARAVSSAIRDPNITYQGNPIKDLVTGSGGGFAPSGSGPQVLSATDTNSTPKGNGTTEGPADPGAYGAGGGSAGGAGSNADLAYLDSQAGMLRGMLGTIDSSYNQGRTGVQDAYNKNVSDTNFNRGRALEDLDIKTQQTERDKDQAIGKVDTYARTLADSVRRRLGLASGSDSSAYQIAAPGAVARDASGKRSGVLEDFGQNFMALDQTKKRASEDYQNLLSDLESQRKSKLSGLESGVLSQKQGIAEKLAGIEGEKARVRGLSYGDARVAQQPYVDQYNQRQTEINSLFDKYRTPYDVKAVQVNTPTLRDYAVDRTDIGEGNAEADPYEPYSNYLKKKDEQLA